MRLSALAPLALLLLTACPKTDSASDPSPSPTTTPTSTQAPDCIPITGEIGFITRSCGGAYHEPIVDPGGSATLYRIDTHTGKRLRNIEPVELRSNTLEFSLCLAEGRWCADMNGDCVAVWDVSPTQTHHNVYDTNDCPPDSHLWP